MSLLPNPALRVEARENARLALPLVAAQLTFIGLGVLDTVMAGRIGETTLAAVAVGANLWVMAFIFFMGLFIACSPIVAQRFGAGQAPAAIGDFARRALLLAIPAGLLWFGLVQLLAAPVVALLGLAPETERLAVGYLRAESWGTLFFCGSFVLRNTAEGLGLPRVVLTAGLCGLVVKALANYALMFGNFGAPALGAVGAGWGTVICGAAMLLVYAVQFRWRRSLRQLQLFGGAWQAPWREAPEILRLGLPIGTILLAEGAFFGVTALLMARFGEAAVAAHQIAINFASVTFMVPLGIALATTVRVGHAAGAGDLPMTRLRGAAGMAIGLAAAVVMAAVMGLRPDWITALYIEPGPIATQAQQFLRYAALFQLFDCLQATANGALRGIKDTRMPMLITLAAYWLAGMPFAWALAFPGGFGPPALWWGFIFGLALAAGGLSWRFFHKAVR